MGVIRMVQFHASMVALQGRGVLILGPSGSGKSSLALELMAVGAQLVADDRTDLALVEGQVIGSCPAPLVGLIEARHVGILSADPAGPTVVFAVVDLGQEEVDRLPRSRSHDLLGKPFPLVFGPYRPHLYAAVRQLVLGGRAV